MVIFKCFMPRRQQQTADTGIDGDADNCPAPGAMMTVISERDITREKDETMKSFLSFLNTRKTLERSVLLYESQSRARM